jgi:hypothetical protein
MSPLTVLRLATDWHHPRAYGLEEKRLLFCIVLVEWSIEGRAELEEFHHSFS